MEIDDRIKAYSERFPRYSPLIVHNQSIYGFWLTGWRYGKRVPGFYGAYQGDILERIESLFPDCSPVLHLFSGTVEPGPDRIRYDSVADHSPDICADVMSMVDYRDIIVKCPLVIADPPYDPSDCVRYGCRPVNKKRVIDVLYECTLPGTFLCWLDTRVPMYSKAKWTFRGNIGVRGSTQHRIRAWSIFERVGGIDV